MKRIILVLLFLGTVSIGHTFVSKVRDGKVIFAKYDYHGTVVWSDKERETYLFNSSTATLSDFKDISPTLEEQKSIDEVLKEEGIGTNTVFTNKFEIKLKEVK
jgi:hypothetical protein